MLVQSFRQYLPWLFLSIVICAAGMVEPASAGEVNDSNKWLRLNQLQYIGTHNSYHIEPEQGVALAIANSEQLSWVDKQALLHHIPFMQYTHLPLQTQLQMGIRKFELDIAIDRQGAKFAHPAIHQLMASEKIPLQFPFDSAKQLQQPGYKVIHVPDIDVRSSCLTLIRCLQEIKSWSDNNPGHFPIHIQLEAKLPSQLLPNLSVPLAVIDAFNEQAWRELEQEIVAVFPEERLISPASVKRKGLNLRDTILTHGWPSLGQSAGKFMFSLDNEGATLDSYVSSNTSSLLFVSAAPTSPQGAWVKLNNAYNPRIKALVVQGYMIRTRADDGLKEAVHNDTARRDRALSTGAHYVDTDFIHPEPRWSPYQVQFPGGKYVRCNPVSYTADCPL